MPALCYDAFDTPIGPLTVAADAQGRLRYVLFAQNLHTVKNREHWRHDPAVLASARQQLLEYLQGQRQRFDLELAPAGTPFQLDVWQSLAQIPYGQTWSYADLAARIQRPNATRAVGAANGRNPLPLVLPCHRVIGRNGALTGFSGGLQTKQALLEMEAAHAG